MKVQGAAMLILRTHLLSYLAAFAVLGPANFAIAASSQISIEPGVFYALDYPSEPPVGIGNSKHVTWAHNPLDGRLYSMGGDFSGGTYNGAEITSSYRQDMYSLSIAERWASRSNKNAGWRQELNYCEIGPGGVRPKSPDFVGWSWDPGRKVFWMVPGTMVSPTGGAICPGRTAGPADDLQYKINHLMTYDPATKVWQDWGRIPDSISQFMETWMGIYDPVTDTIIRFFPDDKASIYDVKTRTWTVVNFSNSVTGRTVYISDAALSPDFERRVIYAVDQHNARLMRWNMDTRTMSDLGPIPGGPFDNANLQINASFTAWDSVNKVLHFFHMTAQRLYIYHPDTTSWETPSYSVDGPSGASPRVNHAMVFDPYENVLLLLGNRDDNQPYDFIYRYKNGPGSDAQPPASPTGLRLQ
jgi:hypothetical protein